MAAGGITVKIDGLKEIEAALKTLSKSTARRVQQRVLMKRAEPIRDAAKAKVPVRTGALKAGIIATTKRPRGHKTAAAQAFAGAGGGKAGRAAAKAAGGTPAEVFVVTPRLPQAHMVEFGSVNNRPQPYLRPAWDALKHGTLDGIAKDLWAEIQAAAARSAKRRKR
jgi:HK97 gp10 family phage protein